VQTDPVSTRDHVATVPPPPEDPTLLTRLFGIDLRSLALFRVVIGSIVFLDLISRSRYLVAHYTDAGVIPRDALYVYLLRPTQWSVHLLSGSAAYQAFLFVAAAVCALAMIFGYRTRWAVILTWLFSVSLQYRNPMVNNSGDALLRVLLFWSMFLPLGARFSFDSAVNNSPRPKPVSVLSIATAALLLQTCIVYWFTAALKDDVIWRADHSAVYYALSIEQFVTPFGKLFYPYPDLMKLMTIFTLYLEIIGPSIVFLPFLTGPIRVAVILAFFGLHLGFGTFMRLGFFPWISAASWLPFVPTWFWEHLFHRLRTPERLGLRLYFDGDCGFCKRMALVVRTFFLLPETPILPAQSDPSIHEDMRKHNSWVVIDHRGRRAFKFEAFIVICRHSPLARWIAPLFAFPPFARIGKFVYETVASNRDKTGFVVRFLQPRPLSLELPGPAAIAVGFLLAYTLLWNIRTLDYHRYKVLLPPWASSIGYITALEQRWSMFAPYPLMNDGWYVIPARLHDGREVDIFRDGQPLDWEKPEWVVDDYPSQRWRKYHMNLVLDRFDPLRRPYAQYRCWDWNRRHPYDEQIDGLDVYFMLEWTRPNYETGPVEKVLLYSHQYVAPDAREDAAPAPPLDLS
jgi:predicted DCC family thiol-disulfide oxidoreductase YuxK